MKKGWQMKTLGEVCEVLNGFAFDSKSFNTHGQGLPLIRIRDVKRGYSETYYSGEYSEAYIVNRGDYLIGMDGEFNIGEWKSGEALLNQRVCKISCDERVLLSKYLFYLIPSHLKDIENKTAFATVKHLSSKQIKALVIPIPPLEEQKRIVAILDSKFAAIDDIQNNATKSIEQGEAMWQATLSQELSPRKGWKTSTLGEVCEVLNGFAFDSKSFNTERAGLPLVRIRDIKRGYSETYYSGEYSETYIVKKGDYLIGMDGEFNIGEWKSGEALLNQRVCKISCDERKLLSKYLFYLIPSHLKDIENKTAFATVKHLSSKQIKALNIPIPSMAEQEQIVKRLDSTASKVNEMKANCTQIISHCAALKQALLRQAFNGEL